MVSPKKLALALGLAFQLFAQDGHATPLFIGDDGLNDPGLGVIFDGGFNVNNFAVRKHTVFNRDVSGGNSNLNGLKASV